MHLPIDGKHGVSNNGSARYQIKLYLENGGLKNCLKALSKDGLIVNAMDS
jgi:hypothetical protein